MLVISAAIAYAHVSAAFFDQVSCWLTAEKNRYLLAMSGPATKLKSMVFYNGMPKQEEWMVPPQTVVKSIEKFLDRLSPDGSHPDEISLNTGAFGTMVAYRVVGIDWSFSDLHEEAKLWLQLQNACSPSVVVEFKTMDEEDLPVNSLISNLEDRIKKKPAAAPKGSPMKVVPKTSPMKRPAAANRDPKDSPTKRPAAAKSPSKKPATKERATASTPPPDDSLVD